MEIHMVLQKDFSNCGENILLMSVDCLINCPCILGLLIP